MRIRLYSKQCYHTVDDIEAAITEEIRLSLYYS